MEAIRTCKNGNKYQGYYCNCDKCSKARKAHNASSARSRARTGGIHKIKQYAASSFAWSGAATIGPVNPSACPKQCQHYFEMEVSTNAAGHEIETWYCKYCGIMAIDEQIEKFLLELEHQSSGNYTSDEVDYMRHPD